MAGAFAKRLALLSAAFVAACMPSAPSNVFELRDLKVVENRVFWIDADTLVFAARRKDRPSAPYDLYLWKPGVSAPVVHRRGLWRSADDVLGSILCASDGTLIVSTEAPRITEIAGRFAYTAMIGPPGREASGTHFSFRPSRLVPNAREEAWGLTPANGVNGVYTHLSGVDCIERYDDRMIGKRWAETYPGLPAVVFDQTFAMQFTHARLDRDGVETPLALEDGTTGPDCIVRTPWNRRMFAWSCAASSSTAADAPGYSHRVWDIDPATGAVQETPVPVTPVTFGLLAIPTKVGLFLANGDTSVPDATGFFRFVDGREVRELKGAFNSATVSPDGCKVALMAFRSPLEMNATGLTVVDVCARAA